MSTARLIHVEDSREDRILARRALEQAIPGVTIVEITDRSGLDAVLDSGSVDLAITDYQLGWSTGLDVLHLVTARHPHCPVIMYTGSGSERVAVEAFTAGLNSYVLKNPDGTSRLVAAVRGALERHELAQRERDARQRAESISAQMAFLADVSKVFAASVPDFDGLLAAVARQAVPQLGDWCFVDLIDTSGILSRRAMAGPGLPGAVLPLAAREEFTDARRAFAWDVIGSARPLTFDHVDDEVVARLTASDQSAEALRARSLTSVMIVPLSSANVSGALTICSADPARAATTERLSLAEEYGRRAVMALENARLLQHAQLASRMKDEFLATVSHELRTPLNSMLGWLWLLRHGQIGPERQHDALETVERNARATAKLIDDLLDLSRVVAGRLTLDREELDLVAVARSAAEAMHPAAEKKHLSLVVTERVPALRVNGDRHRLEQVLANLLSNAIKFTPAGGRLLVDVSRQGDHAQVAITDDGIGIASHVLPTVFDKFRQADQSMRRQYGGLGLGLSIVQQLMTLHGGRVIAESDGVGHGCTFTIRLPLLLTPQPRAAAPALPGGLSGLQGAHILLVDDDADNLELLAFALRSAGGDVTDVDSVNDAMRAFRAGNIDVIVTDIAMPDRDGFTLLEEIRVDGTTGRIPVIAVTAHARMEDRERVSAAGFAAYMAKPIDPDLLVRTVQEILEARGRGDRQPATNPRVREDA
jgi:signal transduction histidine kinase/DNA-binding response OmpR family regulator